MIDHNHRYNTIQFFWNSRSSQDDCVLHNRTYAEALAIAKQFGYQEPRWYKPWTWANWIITTR